MTTAAKKKKPTPIEYVRANYGYLAGFLDVPELRSILIKAAQGEWDSSKLQGAVYATKWWKKTAEVTRQWTALLSTDPAEAHKRIDMARAQVQVLSKRAGVSMSDAQVTQLAYAINKYGWSEQQVQSSIGHHFHYNPAQAASGQAALTIEKLRGIANDYLVPVSNATLQKWAQDVIGGEIDADSFVGYARQQAKSRWPGLADAIDRGVTVSQYTNTYKETIAQALEIDPDAVDLMQPKWSKVIDQVDPKTGVHRAMSLSEAATYARQQPEYQKTSQARDQAAQLTSFLSKTFGVTAS